MKTKTWHEVACLSDLVPDRALAVRIGDKEIAVAKVEGELHAFSNVCTHAYALLSDGFLEDHVIVCPLHEAEFCVKTGKALRLPATIDLQVFPVRVEAERILVAVEDD